MSKISRLYILIILCGGCVLNRQPIVQDTQSQLEIREYQTREYETQDVNMLMKTVLNVLQDDRFIVKNAVTDVGLITAEKEIPVLYQRGDSIQDVKYSPDSWNATKVEECSVNISSFGKSTKVRVNFSSKLINKKKGEMRVNKGDDLKYYHEFFAKVDKGVFLQKQKL